MNALANLFGDVTPVHQSQLPPAANKFHVGNGDVDVIRDISRRALGGRA